MRWSRRSVVIRKTDMRTFDKKPREQETNGRFLSFCDKIDISLPLTKSMISI